MFPDFKFASDGDDDASSTSSGKRQNALYNKAPTKKPKASVASGATTDAASGAMGGGTSTVSTMAEAEIRSLERHGDVTLNDEDYRCVLTFDKIAPNRVDAMVAAKKDKESKGEKIKWHNVDQRTAAKFIRGGKEVPGPSSSSSSSLPKVNRFLW